MDKDSLHSDEPSSSGINSAISRLKGRVPISEEKPSALADAFPISAAATAAAKAEEEGLNNLECGALVPKQGVFLGQWNPHDKDGQSLGKVFNVFAAPTDLTDNKDRKTASTYTDTVDRIAELKNWHGFDGGTYAHDRALYEALQNGSYKGEWVIPTLDLLCGLNTKGDQIVQPYNLYRHIETGAFKGTFKKQPVAGSGIADWYWSCTESHSNPATVWNFRFWNGHRDCNEKNVLMLSCRPVRFVEIPKV